MQKEQHNGPQKEENQLIYYIQQRVDKDGRFDLRFESILDSPINASSFKQLKLVTSFQLAKTWLTWTAKAPNVVKQQQEIHIISEPNTIKATWLGHASFILSIDKDLHILIDPIFEDRIIPVVGPNRIIKSPVQIQGLPPIDYVLISHNHYDHCNCPSLSKIHKKFGNQTTFLIGKQNQSTFIPKNCNAHEMSWTETLTFTKKNKVIKITFVPARGVSRQS